MPFVLDLEFSISDFRPKAGILALFFQIGLEFPAVLGFHICYSREGGNPLAIRSPWDSLRRTPNAER